MVGNCLACLRIVYESTTHIVDTPKKDNKQPTKHKTKTKKGTKEMLYQPLNGFSFSMGVRIEPNSIVEYSTFLHTEVYFYQIFLNHQNSEVNGRRGLEPIHNKAKQWQWNRRNQSDTQLKPVLLTLYL